MVGWERLAMSSIGTKFNPFFFLVMTDSLVM